MSHPLRISEVRVHRLAIPMRFRFEHAAAERDVADPILVEIAARAPYAHLTGWGESLARTYVTGESADSVVRDLRDLLLPLLEGFCPENFGEALEFAEALPADDQGRVIQAARCALELGVLDISAQAFRRTLGDVSGWLGLAGFGPPGALPVARFSGIAVGKTERKFNRMMRLQRCAGLRDFKLKVAVEGWEERLGWIRQHLRPAIERGTATLRVDANGAWSLSEANDALEALLDAGVSVIEQPFSEAHDADLGWLAEQGPCEIMVDESLLTYADGQRLIQDGGVRVFNIRLAKNGGLLPSLKLAGLALQAGLDVQLGCLVGETSILGAAGLAFLSNCPRVRFFEGGYGRWLLATDPAKPRVAVGWGGRPPRFRGPGLGVSVSPERLAALSVGSQTLWRR